MATLNGNNAYLSFAGINLSGVWTDEIDFTQSNETQETTAGAGVTHIQRAPGLNDTEMAFSVIYDDATLASYRLAVLIGTQGTLIYGPEGQVVGKPCHEQTMILSEVAGPNITIDKQKVMFELSFEGAAAPTKTVAGGGVF